MNCVPRGAPGFNDDRRIRNARIYSNPSEICYVSSEADVVDALRTATPGRVRVRAAITMKACAPATACGSSTSRT